MDLRNNPLFKSGFYSFLSQIVLTIYGLVYAILIIRIIPKHEYGLLVIITSVRAFVPLFNTGWLNQAYVKLSSGIASNEYQRYTAATIWLKVVASLILCFTIYTGAPWLAQIYHYPELNDLFRFLPWVILSTFFLEMSTSIGYVLKDFKRIFWIDLVYKGSSVLLIVGGAVFHFLQTALDVLFILFISGLLASLISIITFNSSYYIKLPDFRHKAKELLNFGRFSFGSHLNSVIFGQIDILMLGIWTNSITIANYGVAKRIFTILNSFSFNAYNLIFPYISEMGNHQQIDKVKRSYHKLTALGLMLVAPTTVILFFSAGTVLQILFGEKYLDSTILFQLFTLALLLLPFQRVGNSVIVGGMGRPQINFYSLVAAMITNVTLNLIFIPLFQGEGAVIATLIAETLYAVLLIRYLQKHLNIKHTDTFNEMINQISQVKKYLTLKIRR